MFSIKLSRMVTAILLAIPLFSATGSAAETGRPLNVILFFADDLGSIDLNCYGSTDLHTPNLDDLAHRGVRFTQFYVASPVCSPSRAALITGRYPQRAGVPGNVPSQRGHRGMPPEQVTLGEIFSDAGYKTALMGKWHLGTLPDYHPNNQGFDEFFGHKAGCIDNYSHFFYWAGPHFHDMWRNRQEHWEQGTHFSDLIVRESKRFLEANQNEPFLLYVPFNVPHYPLQAADRFRKMYADLPEPRRSYAAITSHMDDAVGQILAKVDELQLRDRTLVIFLSDHGHSTEERANFGGGNAGPYRGAKFSVLEGGIRVPAIVSLPGKIPQNQTRDQLAISIDWLPTIAEYCDVKLPNRKFDGSSLKAVINDPTAPTPHPTFYWQLGNQWAVRDGDWKLVVNGKDTKHKTRLEGDDRIFLSNMAVDVSETKNIAAQHPDIVTRLTKLHKKWAANVNKKQ